ncbi:MAG: hypothetical protein IT546_07880 [Caulobacteraceae bacterium]|nr:hypothetical protein [Caulobacteraceae bacterium]
MIKQLGVIACAATLAACSPPAAETGAASANAAPGTAAPAAATAATPQESAAIASTPEQVAEALQCFGVLSAVEALRRINPAQADAAGLPVSKNLSYRWLPEAQRRALGAGMKNGEFDKLMTENIRSLSAEAAQREAVAPAKRCAETAPAMYTGSIPKLPE